MTYLNDRKCIILIPLDLIKLPVDCIDWIGLHMNFDDCFIKGAIYRYERLTVYTVPH